MNSFSLLSKPKNKTPTNETIDEKNAVPIKSKKAFLDIFKLIKNNGREKHTTKKHGRITDFI